MSSSVEQIQILYEIAMSIGASLDLQQMLRKSLSTFLKKLNCSAGKVYFLTKDVNQTLRLEKIRTIPRRADRNKACQAALQRLPTSASVEQWAAFNQKLPFSGHAEGGSYFHILELPNVGLMILIKNGKDLDPFMVKSLDPLMRKLASAINACVQNESLMEAHQQTVEVNFELAEKSSELQKSRDNLLDTLKELRLVSARNQAILDAIPDSMFYLNRDGEILDHKVVNAEDLPPGVSREAIVGSNLSEMLPPDLVELTLTHINKTLNTSQMQVFEYQLPVQQGKQDFEARLVVSNPNEALAIVRNITKRKQAEEALRKNEARTRAIITTAPDGIITIDEQGFIESFNPAAEQIFGYKANEAIGQKVNILMPSPYQEEHDGYIANYFKTGKKKVIGTSREAVGQRKGGATFPIYLAVGEVNLGNRQMFTGIIQDITERKRTQQTLSTVLDTVGEGIITIDSTGIIVMVNQEVQNIFEYRQEELIGQNLQMLMPEQYWESHQNGIERYIKTGEVHMLGQRIELEGLKKNGSVFPLEMNITESKIGEQLLFTAAVRDITRRRELDKMRDDFISTVTHELKTPLASIMGWTETLLGERPGPLNDTQQRFLNIIEESSGRLDKLIEEILTVSRLRQGTLKFEAAPFSPCQAVENVQNLVVPLADEKSIALEIFNDWLPEEQFSGDQARLEQAIINLVGNAIKFTPAGGRVCVRSTQQEDGWYFEVEDSGIGIPKADIPRLFQRFFRAGNATESQIQGTGLGLYVCEAIIEGHDGQIGLESEAGVGTTVWFMIPIA